MQITLWREKTVGRLRSLSSQNPKVLYQVNLELMYYNIL